MTMDQITERITTNFLKRPKNGYTSHKITIYHISVFHEANGKNRNTKAKVQL